MTLQIQEHEGFEVAIEGASGWAAIKRGSKLGPIFDNYLDAIDWAYDTELGNIAPPEYDIAPQGGAAAGLALLAIGFAIKGASHAAQA